MSTFIQHRNIIFISGLIVALIAITVSALSYSTGITGRTVNGCTCHGSSNSQTSISVTTQGGDFVVEPGTSENFTVTISNETQSKAGTNIAIKTTESGDSNAGTLTPGSGLKSQNGELTHTSPKTIVNGNAEFNFSWTAPNTPGIYYLRVAGNAVNDNGGSSGDAWNLMSVQQITVPGLELLTPNGGQSLCPGESYNITWNAVGVDNIKIELSSNGGSSYDQVLVASVSASLESWTWNIPSDQTPGTTYRIKISDVSNSQISDESASNFTIGAQAEITEHPQSQHKCTGQTVTFSVTATGTDLTYQWQKDGSNLSGKTSKDLTISNLSLSNAGSYQCIVSSSCGDPVTSNAAVLTLDESPNITGQPESQSVCVGTNVTFTVTASGTDISYQWLKDGTEINGATSPTLNLTNVTKEDEGNYSVRVSGTCDPPAESNNATLTVNDEVAISEQPKSVTACEGEMVSFNVGATGSGLNYQWYKDGQVITGANNSSYIITAVNKQDSGQYQVVVSGDCGDPVESEIVNLNIKSLPMLISYSDTNVVITEGENLSLFVSAQGDSLIYQWRFNGTNIQGANDSVYTIQSVAMSDSGNYDCIISNTCGDLSSPVFSVTVEAKKSGPSISLSQNEIDFGIVLLGERKEMTIQGFIKNTGDQDLTIQSIDDLNESDEFGIMNIDLPVVIIPGESIDLTFEFAPKAPGGDKQTQFEITSNAEVTKEFTVKGFSGIFNLSTSETNVDFGETIVGEPDTSSISIINKGNFELQILNVELSGQDKDEFNLLSPQLPHNLLPNDKLDIDIIFNPTKEGDASADLVINTSLDSSIIVPILASAKIVSVNEIYYSNEAIYPNPAGNIINFEIMIEKEDIYNISIFDLKGNLIKTVKNDLINPGMLKLNWNLKDNNENHLGNGTYYLIISNKDSRTIKKFQIQK